MRNRNVQTTNRTTGEVTITRLRKNTKGLRPDNVNLAAQRATNPQHQFKFLGRGARGARDRVMLQAIAKHQQEQEKTNNIV